MSIIQHYQKIGVIQPELILKSVVSKLAKLKRVTQTFFEVFDDTTFISEIERPSEDLSENICIICFTGTADSVLTECLHGGICRKCGNHIIKTKSKCSLCRIKSNSMYLIEQDKDRIYTIKELLTLENNNNR